jgi:hypothetical protein
VRICEVLLPGNRFPPLLFHRGSVVAAILSGKRCSGVCVKRIGARRGERLYNFARQRRICFTTF